MEGDDQITANCSHKTAQVERVAPAGKLLSTNGRAHIIPRGFHLTLPTAAPLHPDRGARAHLAVARPLLLSYNTPFITLNGPVGDAVPSSSSWQDGADHRIPDEEAGIRVGLSAGLERDSNRASCRADGIDILHRP